MYPKTNFISRNADLFRRLCRLPLAGYELALVRQLERTEEMFIRNCRDRTAGLPQSTAIAAPTQCPQALPLPNAVPGITRPALLDVKASKRPLLFQAAGGQRAVPGSVKVLVADRTKQRTYSKQSRNTRAA